MERLSPEVQTLLAERLVGYLAMNDAAGPYVVPISFAAEGDRIYFHGGPGRKAAALGHGAPVCLAVTSALELTKGAEACSCNFDYSSALLSGQARLIEAEDEREYALRCLVRKYHPEAAEKPFNAKSFSETLVYALEIETASLKTHP